MTTDTERVMADETIEERIIREVVGNGIPGNYSGCDPRSPVDVLADFMECERIRRQTERDMFDARQIGTACAWIEVFARVVVPLGSDEWRTDAPDVGRWIVHRTGTLCIVLAMRSSMYWHRWAVREPDNFSWRYAKPSEIPDD